MDEVSGKLLLFLFIFWTTLTILTSYVGIEVTKNTLEGLTSDATYEDVGIISILDEIPIVKEIVPLLKILTFQYEDSGVKQIGIILNFFLVITVISFVSWVRG